MSRRVIRQVAVALLLAAGWLVVAPGKACAQPSLSHVTPYAVTPGKTTEITLHGSKLAGPLRVWTSFAAHVEMVADAKKNDEQRATCKVSLAAGTPLGIGGVTIATAEGMSDVVYLMIDDLPSLAGSDSNHSPANAKRLSLPAAVDGESDGTLADYYRFSAKVGQRISCEVVAARLGHDFDALVRVLDAAGNELLIVDDDSATGADARFVFGVPSDGDYVLELRDNRFKPGGRYRLRLGEFPLVTTTLPLVAQRGTPTEIAFRGPFTDSLQPVAVLPVGGPSAGDVGSLRAKQTGAQSSGSVTIGLSDLPVAMETSDGAEEAVLAIPGIACGVLSAPRERDVFRFTAAKGTPLRFRAISRSLGSPAIVSLRVLDAAGKQLSESPVTESDEPALSFSPPADGTFKIAVEELAGRGGSDFTYAVECKRGPQFSLVLKNDKNNRLKYSLPPGGAFYLDVQCQRAGYDGPIALAIDSDRAGWNVFNNLIAAKANEVRMYVQPPIDLSPGELAELRVVGKATAGAPEIKAMMATTLQLRAAHPQTPYPPRWHDGTVFVSGQNSTPAFFSIASKAESIDLQRSKTQSQLAIDFERIDPKFKDTPLVVVPIGLPTGATAEVKRNGNGPKETYDINLKLPKGLAVGQHAFRYFAYAEMAGQGRGVLSGDIRLNVLPDEKLPDEKQPGTKPAADAEAQKP